MIYLSFLTKKNTGANKLIAKVLNFNRKELHFSITRIENIEKIELIIEN